MSILDDILNKKTTPDNEPTYHKGSRATVEATNNSQQEENTPPTIPPTPQTETPPVTTFRDAIKPMEPKTLSEEELKKEEKRERTKAILASVADGVSSFANLYFTSKGALSTPQSSMSAATSDKYREALEKRKAEREKYNQMYMNAFGNDMRLGENRASQQRQQANWQQNHDKEQQRYQDEKDYRTARVRKEEEARREETTMRKEQFEYNKLQDKETNALNKKIFDEKVKNSTEKQSSTSNMTSIAYTDPETKSIRTIDFPKSKVNSVVAIYQDLKHRIDERTADYTNKRKELLKSGVKEKEVDAKLSSLGFSKPESIEDAKISMGEGGDSMSRVMTIISRRMREFPELSGRLLELIDEKRETPIGSPNETPANDLGFVPTKKEKSGSSIDFEQHMKPVK